MSFFFVSTLVVVADVVTAVVIVAVDVIIAVVLVLVDGVILVLAVIVVVVIAAYLSPETRVSGRLVTGRIFASLASSLPMPVSSAS